MAIRPAPPLNCRTLGGSPGSPPPPRRRPNSPFSFWLKLRHISSRSGGPSFPPPRLPHCGSFNDITVLRCGRLAQFPRICRFWRARRRCPRGCRLDQGLSQAIHAVARFCAKTNAPNSSIFVPVDSRLRPVSIDLVPRQQLGNRACADLHEHLVHLLDLRVACPARRVHDVQQQVGVDGFFQRRPERRHERVRKIADEPDRVGNRDVSGLRQVQPARRGVESSEEPILGERSRASQGIEQGRLAGVGVTHERCRERSAASARAPLHFSPLLKLAVLVLQDLDASRDQPPVDLELCLAHASKKAPSAALPLQVRPAAHQPRRRVLELRKLHLELALVTLGALGEDVQDQTRAVDDRAAERLLQIALLRGRQVVIENRERGALLLQSSPDLLDFSGTREMGGVGSLAAPAHQGPRADSGAGGKLAELFDALGVSAHTEIQAHEHSSVALRQTLSHRARSEAITSPYQPSGEEWSTARLTAREGTTVEIACLYTICVTVFLRSTTYWSKDSIWPWSLMPFTR